MQAPAREKNAAFVIHPKIDPLSESSRCGTGTFDRVCPKDNPVFHLITSIDDGALSTMVTEVRWIAKNRLLVQVFSSDVTYLAPTVVHF